MRNKKRLIENVGRLNGLSATKKDTQKIKPSADEDFMIAATGTSERANEVDDDRQQKQRALPFLPCAKR